MKKELETTRSKNENLIFGIMIISIIIVVLIIIFL